MAEATQTGEAEVSTYFGHGLFPDNQKLPGSVQVCSDSHLMGRLTEHGFEHTDEVIRRESSLPGDLAYRQSGLMDLAQHVSCPTEPNQRVVCLLLLTGKNEGRHSRSLSRVEASTASQDRKQRSAVQTRSEGRDGPSKHARSGRPRRRDLHTCRSDKGHVPQR
jgi:hypothetical protein